MLQAILIYVKVYSTYRTLLMCIIKEILTPTFLIRSPIILIANILVHGANGGFTLLLLLLFPVTPPTILFPTNYKQEKTQVTTGT